MGILAFLLHTLPRWAGGFVFTWWLSCSIAAATGSPTIQWLSYQPPAPLAPPVGDVPDLSYLWRGPHVGAPSVAATALPSGAQSAVATTATAPAWTPATTLGTDDETLPLMLPDGIPANASPVIAPGLGDVSGNCVIRGEVSDASTLNPIQGAIVEVAGSGCSVETDANGRYEITGLASATFTLEATKLGYFTGNNVVTTLPGQPAEARFGLKAKPVDDSSDEYVMEEETIVGEYQGDSPGDLFLELQAAPNIASGIDKEQFSQAAVSDAAGAVSKISGANIVGGKYAVVRGLGDRYSNTLVNGALISSADPSKKAVQLDLFQSDLLQGVAINKTFTPDLPAEFAGGIVLIETLRMPRERIIEFEFGVGTNSNLGDTFYENPDGNRDFWGERNDDIPLEDLPAGSLDTGWTGSRAPGQRNERIGGVLYTRQQQLEIAGLAAAEMQAVHESGGMKPKKRSPQERHSFAFTLGDRFDLGNDIEIGGVLSFTHEEGDQFHKVQIGRGINYGSDAAPGSNGVPGTEDFVVRTQDEDRYTEFVNWGLLVGAEIKVQDKHEIGLTYFKNTSAEDEVTLARNVHEIGGIFPNFIASDTNAFGAGAYTYLAFDTINPLVRELEMLQFDGTHKLGDEDRPIQLDWMLAHSEASEDRPNSRTLYFSQLDFTDPRIVSEQSDVYQPGLGVVLTSADPSNSNPPVLTSYRESLKTDEQADNGSIDLTTPIWKKSDDEFINLKFGINHFNRDRQVRGRLFSYKFSNRMNGVLLGDNGQYGVDYLDQIDSPTDPNGDSKFIGWTGPQANSSSQSLFIEEQSTTGRTVRNVDAGNEIQAGYLMGTAELAGWGMVGGVRLEKEKRYYQVLPGINPTAFVNDEAVSTINDYALPGITIWRTFGIKQEFRTTFSWSRTVARPTFYEYAPVEIQDQSTGDIIVGNPDLTDTLISNYDLRFDWNPTDRDRISVNLFHKSMTDPIAQSYELEKKTWVNGESGQLTGFEIEASRQLGAGFSITGNYTRIDSLLRYVQQINSSGESQLVDSSFEGQPENIFNMILSYEYEDWGLKSSLVYNLTDSYLTGVPATAESPTITREPFHSLDLVVSKSFNAWNCDGKVTLKVTNLLDSDDTRVFAPTDLVYQTYSPGRGLSLTADFEF